MMAMSFLEAMAVRATDAVAMRKSRAPPPPPPQPITIATSIKCSGFTKRGVPCCRPLFRDFHTCKQHTVVEPDFFPTTRQEWLDFKSKHFTSGKPLALELFKGTGSIDKAIQANKDFDVVSFDIDKYFKPDICADFMTFNFKEVFEPGEFQYLWSSPVCTSWSICTFKHRPSYKVDPELTPKTDVAELGNLMIKKLMDVIDFLKPPVFMIENPRGRLRHWKPFNKWLTKHGHSRLMVYYGNYDHYLHKPTDIWNNVSARKLDFTERRPKDGTFKNIVDISLEQRYAMPQKLCSWLTKVAYEDSVKKLLHKDLMKYYENKE
jgi:hypothetical protein